MIWFSASWIFIILPNSVGLLALPLRMTSVLGSKMLTSFSDTCVSPPKIRAQACRITCSALGIIVSSSLRRPSRAACWKTSEDFLTPEAISREKRFACPTTRGTDASNLPYPCCSFSFEHRISIVYAKHDKVDDRCRETARRPCRRRGRRDREPPAAMESTLLGLILDSSVIIDAERKGQTDSRPRGRERAVTAE